MIDVADMPTSIVRSISGRQGSMQAGLISSDRATEAASRQVSATAQQIAAAAGTLADLAGNLEAIAATTRERY